MPLVAVGPQTAAAHNVAVANLLGIVAEVYSAPEVVATTNTEQAAVELVVGVIGLAVVVYYLS